jgi:hypothetical protein
MRIHEIRTQLSPAEVIERARRFFMLAGTPYAAFEEKVGDGYLKLFLEVGEIMIGAMPQDSATVVRGSASRGEHLLTGFFTSIAPAMDARQTLHRHGRRETRRALVDAGGTADPADTRTALLPATEAA